MADEKLNIDFENSKEFIAKFFMTPEIEGYDHFDKNTKMTNLRSKFQEPELCRAILAAFHVLTNKRYLTPTDRDVHTGSKDLEVCRLVCVTCGFHNLYNVLPEEPKIFCQNKCGSDEQPTELDKDKVENVVITIPLYERKKIFASRYPRVFHALKSKWFGMIETSSARDGHLIKSINERRFIREESIEDRTAVKSQGFFSFKKKHQQS